MQFKTLFLKCLKKLNIDRNYEKHLKKELVKTEEMKKHFHCNKLYDVKDVKVRDYCRVTSKYKSSAQKKFNVNFRLTFKVPVIFHNGR